MSPIFLCFFIGAGALIAVAVMVVVLVRTRPNPRSPAESIMELLEILRTTTLEERLGLLVVALVLRAVRGMLVAVVIGAFGFAGSVWAAICGFDWGPVVTAISDAVHRYRCDSAALRSSEFHVPEFCRR